MAIQFNPNALNAFSNIDFGRDDAIANLGGENNGLVQHGNRGLGVFAGIRFSSTKASNNAVRTELLKALGRAFNLEGVGQQGGKTTFSKEFMDRLEEILGPAFKRSDFGLKNGAVDSGKPLTQRRIRAVCNAAMAYAAENGAVAGAGAVAGPADGAANGKFQDVSALLGGQKIAEIVGGNRDGDWEERAGDLAVLAAKVNRAALTIAQDGAYARVTHKDIEVELHLDNGQIKADVTVGGTTRSVAGLPATREEFCFAMDETVSALYDSFTEKKDGDLTHGRAVLADKVLAYYRELSQDDMETMNECPFRTFASGLLMTKAKVTEAQIAKLTNRQLDDFAVMLCQTGDAPGVKDVVASTIAEADEEDRKLEEEVNEQVGLQDDEYQYELDDGDGNEPLPENQGEPEPQPQPPANGGKVYYNINEF